MLMFINIISNTMKSHLKVVLVSVIFGALAGGLAGYYAPKWFPKSSDELIKDFYSVETATSVSPHHIRKHMGQGDDTFILVDLRSREEYEREHVATAINIPAYESPEKSAYGDVERIVGEFSKLPADKDIIVYCYSIPCMTGRKIGKMLADHDIYVKHLGVGWNEWRYFWTMWNHEHEWEQTNVEDYVTSGPEPGEVVGASESAACPLGGEFGC